MASFQESQELGPNELLSCTLSRVSPEPGTSVAARAVVVGGARGIGAAVARELAAQDWVGQLVVADQLDEEAAELAGELRAAGADVEARPVDLADGASIQRLVEETADAAHVCVAAGIFASDSALDTSRETFDSVLAVNLVGTFQVTQQYARRMVERSQGSIVAIASVAARQPRMLQAAYCASKAGMRQALRVLAMETATAGVRINFVSPGPTDTEMMRRLAEDHTSIHDLAVGSLDAFRTRVPLGRVGSVTDVAAAASFLLSPRAAHIHMHDLLVDGGELLGM
jgi:2,3-dihydro-2,3-dihydroxybenzoate dehydrogenase